MRRVLDTSILIRQLRSDRKVSDLLVDFANEGDELWSSTISRVEVLAGMRLSEVRVTYRLFGIIHWMSVTNEVADTAGNLARIFHRSHTGIDTADYIIASTAIELGAQLVTLNVKHFPMFPNLKPADQITSY